MRWILVLVSLLCASMAHAAPIYSNLGEDVLVFKVPDLVEFYSLDPFRVGAFVDDVGHPFDGLPIMAHPFQPFALTFDGVFYRAVWAPPADRCVGFQVDADSADFAGIGRLLVPNRGDCLTPPRQVPQTPQTPTEPPSGGTPIAEPALDSLVGLGLALWVWRRV